MAIPMADSSLFQRWLSKAKMKKLIENAQLPLGQTARLILELDALRYECCKRTQVILASETPDHTELQYVTALHDALREAHRVLDSITLDILTHMKKC
jgi:hypothetical protein